jgi:hypothetical protein
LIHNRSTAYPQSLAPKLFASLRLDGCGNFPEKTMNLAGIRLPRGVASDKHEVADRAKRDAAPTPDPGGLLEGPTDDPNRTTRSSDAT